ncbi:MAG: hypothetical protein NWE91_04000 [Candidatus Bathyarchaeota archaeon]|nr:hypothetical protein [Candidatus Bathyarchaeota archaeon]
MKIQEDALVKININLSAVVVALIVMAVASFLVMVSQTQIDQLVHGVLYDFGLRFSYRWAMPYWASSGAIVGLSWFNIVASITLVYYIFRNKRSPRPETQQVERIEAPAEQLVAQHEDIVEIQVLDQYCESQVLKIRSYDVRHPRDVVDSQC